MADLSYTVDVNTTPAQRNIDNLNKSIQKLEATFGNLKQMVAGFVLGNLVNSTLQMADAVSDLSKATGIATAQILGFSTAVKENGGDSEGARRAIEKFALSLEEARNGSKEAQDALQAAGLSLKEISNLDANTAFNSYVKGLGKIEGETARLANANSVLGKGMRTVDFEGVASAVDQYTINSAKAAIEAEKVGEMVDNMDKAFGQLQKVLLTVLQPVADFINWLSEGGKAATAFLDVILAVGLVFAGGWIGAGIKALVTFASWLTSTATGLTVFGTLIGATATKIADFFGVIDLDKLREWVGLQTNAAKKAEEQAAAEQKLKDEYEKARKEAEAKELQIKKASAAVELAAQKQIDATKKSIDQYNTQFDMNTKLMGQTEEQKLSVTTLYDLQQRKIAALLPLQEKLRELQAIPVAARGATDKAEIAATQNAIASITKQYDDQVPVVKQLLGDRIKQMMVERDLAYNADLMTKAYERQLTLADQLRSANDKMVDVKFETAQMKRSPLEKQFAQIQEDARKAALEAGRAFSAGFEDMDLTSDQAQELANGLDQIAQKYKAIADAQSANLAASRSFSQGWKEAFDSYMDNATNAATRASEVFGSITNNMNSAIDNFVDTGKFKFSDLATSIIKDLLKIELKAQASMIMKSMGGLGGIFSGIGSIFGFAEGGQPPINKPSIVGEQGPELFIPKTAGTVIPNDKMGMGGTTNVTNITNNVSAIDAKSVAQFFAENRRTLLGTVQLAQKEMPYGNR